MTRQYAMNLQNTCERLLSGYLGTDCSVCLSLSRKLKISFHVDDHVLWDMESNSACFIKYFGYYADLTAEIEKISKCVSDYRKHFDDLVWSYEHIKELEE